MPKSNERLELDGSEPISRVVKSAIGIASTIERTLDGERDAARFEKYDFFRFETIRVSRSVT
jgi:hypothetical protein